MKHLQWQNVTEANDNLTGLASEAVIILATLTSFHLGADHLQWNPWTLEEAHSLDRLTQSHEGKVLDVAA